MMTIWALFAFVSLLSVQSTTATKSLLKPAVVDQWKVPLGRGYYLPDKEIGAALPIYDGVNIFKPLSGTCYVSRDFTSTVDDRSYFENIDTFYESISSDSDIDIKFKGVFTMGFTLKRKTNNQFGGSSEVIGTSINNWKYVRAGSINKDCIEGIQHDLTQEIIDSVDGLPAVVNNAEKETTWTKYEDFLKIYGTHVVKETYFGAGYKFWTFARSDNRYTHRQMEIKSCLDFQQSSFGNLNISACSRFSNEEAESVKNLNVASHLETLGGSDKTKNQLGKYRTKGLINKLLHEATLEMPIQFKYTPIWEILRHKFTGNTERYAKAVALQKYFEGFLDFGCEYLPTNAQGLPLRKFTFSNEHSNENPDFWCVLEREGCHNDTDCHLSGQEAYCYGSTCVEHFPALFGYKAMSAEHRTHKSGKGDEGINDSCKYQANPKAAKCDLEFSDMKVLWHKKPINTRPPASGTGTFEFDKLGYVLVSIGYICGKMFY